jgi:hypothetical protein
MFATPPEQNHALFTGVVSIWLGAKNDELAGQESGQGVGRNGDIVKCCVRRFDQAAIF